jgi:hypothetical protein
LIISVVMEIVCAGGGKRPRLVRESAAFARWGGQRLNRGRLVMDADMRVDAQRETFVAVPGEGLRHLGRQARSLQVRDEQVAIAVEVRVFSVSVDVHKEVRILPPSHFRRVG